MPDNPHVVIIDDEKIQCDVFSEYLRSQDFEVTSFVCSKEALDFFKKSWNNIDLVILDIGMPHMDGHEVFMLMQEIDPAVKVLFSTGYGINGELQKLKDKGAEGILQKPFKPETLCEHVTIVLKK